MKTKKTRRKRRVRARQSLKFRMREAAKNGVGKLRPHPHVELSVLREKYQKKLHRPLWREYMRRKEAERKQAESKEKMKQALGVLAPPPLSARNKK